MLLKHSNAAHHHTAACSHRQSNGGGVSSVLSRVPNARSKHARTTADRVTLRRLALVCGSIQGSSDNSSSSPDDTTPPPSQQQQPQASSSNADESAGLHPELTNIQKEEGWYPPEQQLLRTAWKRLQALEAYQELLGRAGDSTSSSSSKGGRQLQRMAGDTPADVAAKIAADRDELPLLDAAILIAQHAYPDLDAAAVKQQLDDLAAEVEESLPAESRYPLRVLKEINRVLYQVHGFKGNTDDYYNPDNSCINRVLETKQGIPITLSLVYMEVAARVGLPMSGTNFPAHFMLRPQVDGMEWLVDAFNGGELTALQDAEELLGRLMGYEVKLDPRFVSADAPPLSSRAFLLRLLNNLRQIYVTLNMSEEALSVVRYMQATAPAKSLPELHRDEGLCLYSLGRYAEATDALLTFLGSTPKPDARDTALVEALLEKIKERAAAAAARAAAARAARKSGSSISSSEEVDDVPPSLL